ncbi:hypothetical protein [Sinomonas sp. RB5]
MATATRTERLALTRKAHEAGYGTPAGRRALADELLDAFYGRDTYDVFRSTREELVAIDSCGESFTSIERLTDEGVAAMTAAAHGVGEKYGLRVGRIVAEGRWGWVVTVQAECPTEDPEWSTLCREAALPAKGYTPTAAARDIAALLSETITVSIRN